MTLALAFFAGREFCDGSDLINLRFQGLQESVLELTVVGYYRFVDLHRCRQIGELMAAEEEVGFDRQILFFLFLVLIRHHGVTVHQRLAHVVFL